MKHILTLATAFLAVALTAAAQVDFNDKTAAGADRVKAALAAIENATPPSGANAAANFLLGDIGGLNPLSGAVNAEAPGFVDSVISDPTIGGKADDPQLKGKAIIRKAFGFASRTERISLFVSALSGSGVPVNSRTLLKSRLGYEAVQQAGVHDRAFDLAAAESVLTTALPFAPDAVLQKLADVKVANSSPDALVTALRAWLVADFYNKASATQTVASALQVEPGFGFDAANSFISWVNTGTGVNPVSKVKIPKLTVDGGPGKEGFYKLILSGENEAALALARRILASNTSQAGRNEAGRLVLSALANARFTTSVESDAKAVFGAAWTFTPAPTPAPETK